MFALSCKHPISKNLLPFISAVIHTGKIVYILSAFCVRAGQFDVRCMSIDIHVYFKLKAYCDAGLGGPLTAWGAHVTLPRHT